ncbi:MAG: methyltransferase domain-containing protein [Thermodesulfobacteriota bacterium]
MSNEDQYSITGILRYEWIFGYGFLGYGEPEVTRELIRRMDWPDGLKVLDVGCGLGGAAFLMAREHQARITGVDLTEEIVNLARERQQEQGISGVDFIQGDIHGLDFSPESFDVIWSRETLLHVPEKEKLFNKFYRWMAPGGRLSITDYARRQGRGSQLFEEYIEESGYPLPELSEYSRIVRQAGFSEVQVEDKSEFLAGLLEDQLHKLENNSREFCRRFSTEDFQYLKDRWQLKLDCCRSGDMKWAWILAKKQASV